MTIRGFLVAALVTVGIGKSVPEIPIRARPGVPLGKFQLTYYWAAEEAEFPEAWATRIYDRQCAVLASVSVAYLKSLAMEGTGVLSDGRLVNFESRCVCGWENVPCFQEISEDDPRRFGIGVNGRGLQPFRSVAVDERVVKVGTHLYVPDLDGLLMPGEPPWGGFVHDGCLVADDRGGAIDNQQLDFYSLRRSYYREIDGLLHRKRVWVFDGASRCP